MVLYYQSLYSDVVFYLLTDSDDPLKTTDQVRQLGLIVSSYTRPTVVVSGVSLAASG